MGIKKYLSYSTFLIVGLLLCSSYARADSINLTWNEPTTNSDDTPLTYGPLNYKIYIGISTGVYSTPLDIGRPTCIGTPSVCTYTVSGLANGVWYFVVTAYNTLGSESEYSNEVSETIILGTSMRIAGGQSIAIGKKDSLSLVTGTSMRIIDGQSSTIGEQLGAALSSGTFIRIANGTSTMMASSIVLSTGTKMLIGAGSALGGSGRRTHVRGSHKFHIR